MFDTRRRVSAFLAVVGLIATAAATATASELYAGAASADITPDRPVALAGHMEMKIATVVRTPLVAAALAMESRDGDRVLDQALFVACDLVTIPDPIRDRAREQLRGRIPGFDPSKLVLSATHSHTSPVMEESSYPIPKQGVMQPAEYAAFLVGRIADAAEAAWKSRGPSRVGWGLGQAVVAHNRRMIYADGHAEMYGATDRPDFRGIEGPEDHGVEVVFVWDATGKLRATAINVACPSQVFDAEVAVDADFWHPIREALKTKHGASLVVLGWGGAAGDQSPRVFLKRAEERMRRLRNRSRTEEIAARVVATWDEAHEAARLEQIAGAPLVHKVESLDLPPRLVTEAEAEKAAAEAERLSQDPASEGRARGLREVVERRRREQSGAADPYRVEVHVLRLGDVAIATNPFELYTPYGLQMKARSPALQTFVIQLAGSGSYVPTAPALRAGGYSTGLESNRIGPEGGQRLVDQTVEWIDSLWPR